MSQNRSSAVMEQRAPRQVEGDNDTNKRWRDLDFFPTPPWAARAGAELVQSIDHGARAVWEPACGMGHMSEPLRDYFSAVYATDIHHYGCNVQQQVDFLDDKPLQWLFADAAPDWIITNPPFMKAAEFVTRGLDVATRGVAIICRMAFLESAARYPLLFQSRYPLTAIAPFIERVPMQLGCWDPQGHSATAYAWFLFAKQRRQQHPIVIPIPPGTRTRLTRPGDAERFGMRSAQPLFDDTDEK